MGVLVVTKHNAFPFLGPAYASDIVRIVKYKPSGPNGHLYWTLIKLIFCCKLRDTLVWARSKLRWGGFGGM